MHSVSAVSSELNLALGIPTRVIAYYGNKRQTPPDCGLKLCQMEADRSVAEYDEYWRVLFKVAGR